MKKATYIPNYDVNLNNKVFDSPGGAYLRSLFARHGYDLQTIDIHKIDDSDIILQADLISEEITSDIYNDKSFLIIWENEVIVPRNFIMDYHKRYKAVFTWHEDLVDNSFYYKINYGQYIPSEVDFLPPHEKTKLCVLINAKKFSCHKDELYSERIRLLDWFEKHHFGELDLYGVGWGESKSLLERLLDLKLNFKRTPLYFTKHGKYLLRNEYKSYQGPCPYEYKITTMRQYKFAICFENASYPGYITEKIFDCFFAGCVPIYLGAPNILEYIPKNTFIDFRNFTSYKDLYSFITNMSDKEYSNILQNIHNYLMSEEIKYFSAFKIYENVVDVIMKKMNH
ncbi:MAG: glycosyltransferase family 10 [Firmicutes bacterium]|nr:glycosyltransferase family 10 [Bacillota bacterium]